MEAPTPNARPQIRRLGPMPLLPPGRILSPPCHFSLGSDLAPLSKGVLPDTIPKSMISFEDKL